MAERLRAGVIGLGFLGSQHVGFLRGREDVQLVAVADLQRELAERVAADVGAAAYDDVPAMLQAARLDLVVIATPDHAHRAPFLAAVAAKVPAILCEKPLATVVAEAEEMADAAEQAGVRVFVNFSNRGSPLDRATYYVLQHGLLGDVIYGDIHLDDNITVPTEMWGQRTRDWVGASSTAHFLLSHVVDYLRWTLAPAEVREVYAVSQQRVLGYTPDLYDAYLQFDSGARMRIKAEWIKRIDGLVELSFEYSGAEGYLSYIKRPAFGEREGWRANLRDDLDGPQLLEHQRALSALGIEVEALVHRPMPVAGALTAGGGALKHALQSFELRLDQWRLGASIIDAVREDTLTPASWSQFGPLPTVLDGLQQTRVCCAIADSAASGKPITL